MHFHFLTLSVLAALASLSARADEAVLLPETVVTAAPTAAPLTVTLDPKASYSPAPATDGAGLLKSVPGFAVTRKGGSGGDPLLRGLGAGRLDILVDGTSVYGGCGGRMDPPTAYLFPETFDRVTVLKGPQSVQHGPVPVAGSVLFERETPQFGAPGVEGDVSLLVGSRHRVDGGATVTAGSALGYVRLSGQYNDSHDYRDGAGQRVHSAATRRSGAATVGFTPDDKTLIEFGYDVSRGEGAYADRMMDGVKFDRDAWRIKLERRDIAPWLEKLSASYYRSYVDHVMDNYSLRRLSGMAMVSNPDREVEGGRLAAALRLGELNLDVGADFLRDWHTFRSGRGMSGAVADAAYQSATRDPDMKLANTGVFVEGRYPLNAATRVLAGLRHDRAEATDQRSAAKSSTGGQTDTRDLNGGFVRLEHQPSAALTLFAGYGQAERAPDYWERSKQVGTVSSFNQVAPETNRQLDAGALWQSGALQASASLFYSRIDDFILIESKGGMGAVARNVDATRYGGEAELNWRFAKNWKAGSALAWVWGSNDSDKRPLGQTPPLEWRLSLGYDDAVWSAGGLLRLVARQTRLDPGRGNVIGQDLADPAGGFATLALHAGYKPRKDVQLTAGVDNLFDRAYAEAISRGGASVADYGPATLRVNEPGRTWWLKGKYSF